MANKEEAEPKSPWWRKLFTLPGMIATAVLTASVGAGVTWLVPRLEDVNFSPADAIKLHVETDPGKMTPSSQVSPFGSAVIPSSVRTHGTPGAGGCDGFHSWVVDNLGVDAGATVVQIAAQGTTDKPVLIQNVRASVIDSSPPLTGIAVDCSPVDSAPPPSGTNVPPNAVTQGPLEVREGVVILDASQPAVVFQSGYKKPLAFTLKKGETESFAVSAIAAHATYRWKVQLDVVVNGVADTLEVGGKNGFTTTAEPAPHTAWEWNWKDGWDRSDPADPTRITTLPASAPLPATA